MSKKNFVCALIQMNSSQDLARNLHNASESIKRAGEQGAQLVILPEAFAFIGKCDRDQLQIKETLGHGRIQDFLSCQAADNHLWIVGGTIPMDSPDQQLCYATSIVVDSQGKTVSHYRKIHLFDAIVPEDGAVYQESDAYYPGSFTTVVSTPFGHIGLSVCYDLRFPELYRKLVNEGAEIIILSAAFTLRTGQAHWHTLLRARAIENQAWVVACNQSGSLPNGVDTYGHSCFINPWGELQNHCANDGEQLLLQRIDTTEVYRLRSSFPCLKNRVLAT